MKRILAVGALLALASPASAQGLFPSFFGGGSEPESTMTFRAEALRTDAYVVESSKLALERSRSPRVRAYARQTIKDHTETTAALLPPGAALNATGNVVSEQEAGLFGNGVVGIVSSPLSIPVNFIGNTFGGGQSQDGHRIAIDQRRAQALNTLSSTQGQRAFNATYTSQQIASHTEAVALYSREAENGTSPEGRVFASQALPVLQRHLNEAVRLDERVGGSSAEAF